MLSQRISTSFFLLPDLLYEQKSQRYTHKRKKKKIWLCSFALCQGIRDTPRLRFPAPNLRRLPTKRETFQTDSIVDLQHDYPDSGSPDASRAVDTAEGEHGIYTGSVRLTYCRAIWISQRSC